jgi:hypothetical protein
VAGLHPVWTFIIGQILGNCGRYDNELPCARLRWPSLRCTESRTHFKYQFPHMCFLSLLISADSINPLGASYPHNIEARRIISISVQTMGCSTVN